MSGSGGGGGGSGVVDYPAHMKTFHEGVLGNGAMVGETMTAALAAAYGASPWAAAAAYDPDTSITALIAAPNNLETLVNLLSAGTSLDTLVGSILDHTRVDTAVTEYAADLDAELVATVLPRFQAGMRDINAVVSSAFVIGQALIEQGHARQLAKFSSALHMKAFSDDAIAVIGLKLQYQHILSMMIAETNRIKIVAKKEEADTNLKIGESDALWDLEVFQYGANLLASIGGGVAGTKSPSQAQSVLGGAMSGAAAGAMVSGGNPIGAIIGGFIGAASGFL